jgi:Fungal Zn(2)-Cys(6) binuclear cluster domain
VGNIGHGILPTPDPTIASCISDEDVARQLIALGDASNFSLGRTSASTLDDAFSGVADVASSTGATSDSDEYSDHDMDLPKQRGVKTYLIDDGADDEYQHENIIKSEEFDGSDGPSKTKKIKTKMFDGSTHVPRARSSTAKSGPTAKHRATLPKLSKSSGNSVLMKAPSVPVGSPVRKTSASMLNFQHHLAADEEDLSSKPRCQRCRKSKKGCDRQRPCQRCKDAGIGIEGCVSEDEGNGRKGRYGRHMGVVVKKPADDLGDEVSSRGTGAIATEHTPAEGNSDKSKKRKR